MWIASAVLVVEDMKVVDGSRLVLGTYTAKLRWPLDVQVQGTRRAPDTAELD